MKTSFIDLHSISWNLVIQQLSGIFVMMKAGFSFGTREDVCWDHPKWSSRECLNHAHWPNAKGRWNTNVERYPLERQLGSQQERWTRDVWKISCLCTPFARNILFSIRNLLFKVDKCKWKTAKNKKFPEVLKHWDSFLKNIIKVIMQNKLQDARNWQVAAKPMSN